jgi:hypothetical protein
MHRSNADRPIGRSANPSTRRCDMSDKVKEAFENAKKAVERRDDQIEQTAAQKVEPHLHEARERLAEASREK